MACEQVVLRLPGWVGEFLDERGECFGTEEERMRLIIELSQLNVDHKTGGPFGAGVFEQQTGRIVAVGVNLVESANCSIAHAEMVAIALAQRRLGHYDLGAEGQPTHELVTSTEPCAMCLGAIPWSGVQRVVCGARGEDAAEIGFDEGAKPEDWVGSLQSRGVAVARDVLRQEARAILLKYRDSGGLIYNARRAPRRWRS